MITSQKRYRLLNSQLAVFEECMAHPECRQYNLPSIAILEKDYDIERLVAAFHVAYNARAEWRIRFGIDDSGKAYQMVDDTKQFHVGTKEMSESEFKVYARDSFCRVFDIMGDEPLVRVECVKTPEHVCMLMDVHHLIMDGVSYAMLFAHRDYSEAFTTGSLSPSRYGMLDAVIEEQKLYTSQVYQTAKEHYAAKFRDLDFATVGRHTDNPIGSFIRTHAFVPSDVVDRWCEANGVMPNLLFQAAFTLAVVEATGKSRIAYTIYNHGRFDKRWRDAYGMFSREMPVVTDVTDSQSVTDLMHSIKTELIEAIRYSAYPITDLCRDLNKTTGICFNFQATEDMEESLIVGDKSYQCVEIERGEDGHDMVVFIFLYDGMYDIRIESSSAINSLEVVQSMTAQIKKKVTTIIQ